MPTAASLRLAQTRLEMAVWLHQEATARSQTPGGGAPASSPLAMLAGLALNAAGHRLQHGGTPAHPPAASALLGLACGTAARRAAAGGCPPSLGPGGRGRRGWRGAGGQPALALAAASGSAGAPGLASGAPADCRGAGARQPGGGHPTPDRPGTTRPALRGCEALTRLPGRIGTLTDRRRNRCGAPLNLFEAGRPRWAVGLLPQACTAFRGPCGDLLELPCPCSFKTTPPLPSLT